MKIIKKFYTGIFHLFLFEQISSMDACDNESFRRKLSKREKKDKKKKEKREKLKVSRFVIF